LPTNEEILATLSKGAAEVIEIDIPKSKVKKKAEGETYTTNKLQKTLIFLKNGEIL
jgi:lysophospholipid acyltransferase (LPLAT)-like uncharacterized protein